MSDFENISVDVHKDFNIADYTLIKRPEDNGYAYVNMTLDIGDTVLDDVEAGYGHLDSRGGWSVELSDEMIETLNELGIEDPEYDITEKLNIALGIDFEAEGITVPSQSYCDAVLQSAYEFGEADMEWASRVVDGKQWGVIVEEYTDEEGYEMANVSFEGVRRGSLVTIENVICTDGKLDAYDLREELDRLECYDFYASHMRDEIKDEIVAGACAYHESEMLAEKEICNEKTINYGL